MSPAVLYGADDLLSVAVGARLYLGGGPMRMGAYGGADAMQGAEHHDSH